eukprot:5628216-Lingulodinium_polyedra.AAC.1
MISDCSSAVCTTADRGRRQPRPRCARPGRRRIPLAGTRRALEPNASPMPHRSVPALTPWPYS